MKNKNTISFLVLLIGIVLLLLTSILLEIDFFTRKAVRQIVVYFIMACQVWIMYRILKNVNQ